ncbi:ribosome maturation factor RimM [Venenivibrio stagnispumantis]|uniref:Ribosome maturation factor RimM n=1 Tax=Venenivibrio stagnispumantis TaxID=407998 RepID=A0AA46ADK6_9AQUI|nr:ribosome maturation factor RimM [Venenivibrio stagnispumantis]MCW4573527.1 ribosome maturation factor RimM [Venenivibrio stagnispumantis]SMP06128.1 16S rRNA processing protein RimM [Venenivibrio stagnispumantis]
MVIIGKLHKAHGIKGNIKIEIYLQNFRLPDIVYIKEDNEFKPLQIEFLDRKTNLVKFKNIDTPEKAKELNQKYIYIEEDKLPKLKKDEFYHFQLIDCYVVLDDKIIGKVENIDDRTAQPLLIIKDGEKERILPFIKEFVKEIDIKNKKIYITPPEDWINL